LTSFSRSQDTFKQAVSDITLIILILLFLWELLTNRFDVLTSFIYPTPGAVLQQFQQDGPELLQHLLSSVGLLASGYLLAVCLAIPLGILSAWFGRLGRVMSPISSVLAPIPPIILIPYAIAVLPSFRASSIFIIFIGAFWPIFVAALNGVAGIDRRYVNSARTLGVSHFTLFSKIILPAALPSIFTGLSIGMILSFILLTSAEMIGANAGLGFYVKLATDFGSYTKVVAGIIFIGIFVTIVMTLLGQLERYLLRWRK
jgi:NitT/TauT family transport system permease protein